MILDADIIKWLLMVAVGALGYWARNQDKRLTALELSNMAYVQRITTLEAHYADILNRLGRIEEKLDALRS